ncbi:hypothetical protein ACFU5D_16300 [Streptomyces anthocyanicus]|uniref:hypothetical protein n=1 Tax=Streptomyces anthocyanicus TaxID=68174 RepID=UPI0036B71AB3
MAIDVEQMLIDIRFYEQLAGDAKRVIYCEPHMTDAVQGVVEAAGDASRFTVRSSPACPVGKLLVVDEQGIEAAMRQDLQTWRWRP